METFKYLNLGLRFLLELCMLAALAYGGYHLPIQPQILFAILLPVAAATVWGMFIAPKASRPLPVQWRVPLELTLFAIAALLLALAGQWQLAIIFAVVVALNEIILAGANS